MASALAALSDVSMTLGDRPGARRAAAEALEAAERLGRSETVGVALDLLGACALEEGDLEAAFAHFHAALRAFAENSKPGPVCEMVDRLAAVAAKRGDAALAGRLLGAASARREDLDWKSDARTRAFRDGLVDEIRASLGEDAYRRADEAGRGLTLDEAVALGARRPEKRRLRQRRSRAMGPKRNLRGAGCATGRSPEAPEHTTGSSVDWSLIPTAQTRRAWKP